MALSWNEIKRLAIIFQHDWKDATRENADSQTYWNDFFNIFGINRRRVATFEHNVSKHGGDRGRIDVFWPGTLLIESKSAGKSLEEAKNQALGYFPGIKEADLPRYILLGDLQSFRLIDLEENTDISFPLNELITHIDQFGFIAGYSPKTYHEGPEANILAAEKMGKLHDALKAGGYEGHELEVLLVRLLFCLFADDTTIFSPGIFYELIDLKTSPDGSDLGERLSMLFQTLNKPLEKRANTLDESLAAFPYINGKLFEQPLEIASFSKNMRDMLLECCAIKWEKISPAIFGSLFQSVMNPKICRDLGAHYTSEKNIKKVIGPLFMDELKAEFTKIKTSTSKLTQFHKKISQLRFLDPACGCGNFLVISYREIRLLEMEVINELLSHGRLTLNIEQLTLCDVNSFYGIEIEEFPAQIAQVAMWLTDHQMNMLVSKRFGQYFVRLPLLKSANILHADALVIDWQSLVEHDSTEMQEIRYDYILGNPPFIGSKLMTQDQRDKIKLLFGSNGAGVLDYVCGWYLKAAQYMKANPENYITRTAFVSTNSIVQGEQVAILWGKLILQYNMRIQFAHRTFKWSNEGRGVAAVYCVIVCYGTQDIPNKTIYDYETPKSEPMSIEAININPYLVDAGNIVIEKRSKPICKVPEMSFGNMPLDGGHLLLSDEEKRDLETREPDAKKFIRPLISAYEFLNGLKRWCLWLEEASPDELRKMPMVLERIKAVKVFRESSIAPSTQKFALTPALFRDRNIPETSYVFIPRHSSENRGIIPLDYLSPKNIISDSCLSVPNATLYHFGVLTSKMHMAWVKYVCGRLKSDFRYSKDIVYNNYPWPKSPAQKDVEKIEQLAQAVLDARAVFPGSSLADLYDPISMPPALSKAHHALDAAVDKLYRPQAFPDERRRIEYLFGLYEQYTADLFVKKKTRKSVKNK